MQLFARITKVDATKRQVTGVLVQEVVDRSGEIFDYATSKAHFVAWSDGISKATEGKSVGNLRVMHGNTVAGKFSAIDFNDAAKSIEVVADVVDDNEWKKCEAGCYTGFSIGGRYEKKWDDAADPTIKRYTAIPSEGSLVDLPCVPTAQFKMVKADGSDEMRKFVAAEEPVAKGMSHVAQLACLLREIGYLTQDQYDEAAREGDGSAVPAELEAWLQSGAALLVNMTSEEAAELVAESSDPEPDDAVTIALAAGGELAKETEADPVVDPAAVAAKVADAAAAVGDVEKVGATHSAATLAHHAEIAKAAQSILDHCAAMATASKVAEDDLAKVADLTAARDDALAKLASTTAELDALKAAPKPIKAAALSVSKVEDTGGPDPAAALAKDIDSLTGEDKVKALIKMAHLSPK